MLYVNDNQEAIIEITTEDGYKLYPNYNHSGYQCGSDLIFEALVFDKDFKAGHFGLEDGVKFFTTKTIAVNNYYKSRIPQSFDWLDDTYTLIDSDYWSSKYELNLSIDEVKKLGYQIQINSWTSLNTTNFTIGFDVDEWWNVSVES